MPTFQDALNIYVNPSTLDKLAITYGEVTDMFQKSALSVALKNTNFTGQAIKGGTVHVRRLRHSNSQAYGTARTAGEGNPVTNDGVDLKINTDREIVEELEAKDVELYGIPNLIERRKEDHAKTLARELDRAFFVEAQTAAATVDLTPAGSAIQDKVEYLIQQLETLSNDHVDGVDREDMELILSPYWYGKLENYLDTLPNPTNGGVSIKRFHNVRVWSNTRQGVDAILMVKGSVAQPLVLTGGYMAERIPLSNATAVELFYSFGTKAVMPDLILKAGLDGNISI